MMVTLKVLFLFLLAVNAELLLQAKDLDTLEIFSMDGLKEGTYCLGAQVQNQFKCYTYDKYAANSSVNLITKPNGGLLSFHYGREPATKRIRPGPEPLLRAQKLQIKEKEEVEEEEKSFIQKYWMFLVPVVLVLMMASPEDK